METNKEIFAEKSENFKSSSRAFQCGLNFIIIFQQNPKPTSPTMRKANLWFKRSKLIGEIMNVKRNFWVLPHFG